MLTLTLALIILKSLSNHLLINLIVMKKSFFCGVTALVLTLASSSPLTGAELDKSLIHAHWFFAAHRQQGQKLMPIQGGPRPVFKGRVQFLMDPIPPRVELSGGGERLILSDGPADANLPQGPFAIETWVRMDGPSERGGIIGAIQHDPDIEAGWILGYREDRFCFGLVSEAQSKLTYLESQASFVPGKWYLIVGNYSGSSMELWVDGARVAQSHIQQGKVRYPKHPFYEIGAFHDNDQHFSMKGAIHEIILLNQAMPDEWIESRFHAKKDYFPEAGPDPVIMEIPNGPFVDWIGPDKVSITWSMDVSMPSRMDLMGPEGEFRQFNRPDSELEHSVIFDQLQKDGEYSFRIYGPSHGDRPQFSSLYKFDTSFYYAPVGVGNPEFGAGAMSLSSRLEQSVSGLLNSTRREAGFALILGAGEREREMAHALVRLSRFKVILVDPDSKMVQQARSFLDEAGVYGERVSVHHGEYASLPYGAFFANLVIVHDLDALNLDKDQSDLSWLKRMIRPAGGTFCVALSQDLPSPVLTQLNQSFQEFSVTMREEANLGWFMATRGELVGGGQWSHQYGGADNSSCSQDALVHGELGVLWWGDPGPRPMPDRGPRNPAPISVNGRLFIQGDRVLFGLDSYNGTILWNYFSPEMRRANLPRDCSNMVGTHDYLYIAQGRHCIGVEGDTGRRSLQFEAVRPEGSPKVDWGYLATVSNTLIGSSVKSGSRYLGDDGQWFEEFHPEDVSRVTSMRLFGLNRHTGEQSWIYEGGAIINSTITIGNQEIYFLESRNPAAMAALTGRLEPEILTDVRLVCLDLETGKRQWERVHDFSDCQFTTYMTFSNDTLIVTGTDKDKRYHSFAFNTSAAAPIATDQNQAPSAVGSLLWEESHEAGKNHHSGHLQHPVVIGDTFYSDQRAFSLRDGKLLRTDLPERRGCGTMSAALKSIFYRHYYHGQWDLESNKRVQFEGLRSGCWLGMIPAGGVLLAPEASAGCSCANAIQTSIGYVPKHLDPSAFSLKNSL